MKVLMIDDDVELGEAMQPVLEKYGIALVQALTPQLGLRMLMQDMPDVVLLDMMLPEIDGMSVCHEIRTAQPPVRDVPIIALSARAELTDRIVGLESGIDDYIAKPVEMRELVARLRAVQRWQRPAERRPPSNDNELVLDETRLEAHFAGVAVHLTELEMHILKALATAHGKVLSRSEILVQIRHSLQTDPAVIDTVIYRLRRKFRDAGRTLDCIQTVRGRGYRISSRSL